MWRWRLSVDIGDGRVMVCRWRLVQGVGLMHIGVRSFFVKVLLHFVSTFALFLKPRKGDCGGEVEVGAVVELVEL